MDDGILSPTVSQHQPHTSGETRGNASRDESRRPTHQRLVFTDPAAFRYLEEDPSTTVLERRRRLKGYELYFVEAWACSRKHPTFVITTYTGLDQHSVVVSVLSVPTNEETWSPRLRVYLRAIKKYHARAKETPLGILMVTNLSNFPSALTVINVPDGDLRNNREAFILNEDLKRLGCTGRAGLNIGPPNGATEAKFRELYRTSDQIPIHASVVELVKLCQAALILFGMLPAEYADGLLCDVTEQKVSDWWAEIGGDYFNTDPADGILGPTTVAAMLGLLMGARNRLQSFGASVGKDVFDIASTKRAISQFQKAQRIERTRRLDRRTLDRLHKVTAKAANSETRAVPRVVKSTVAELSGKGGLMVNARDKGNIAAVESIDIEDLIALGSGGRFKWLWQGKPRKHEEPDPLSSLDDGLVFDDEQGGGWESKKKSVDVENFSLRHTLSDRFYQASHNSQNSLDHLPPDQALRRAALKNIAEQKATEPKSGLGRLRDAMTGHRRNHSYLKQIDLSSEIESLMEPSPIDSTHSRTSDPSIVSPRESASQSVSNSQQSSRRPSKTVDHEYPNIWKPPVYDTSTDSRDKSYSSLEDAIEEDEARGSIIDMMNHADGVTSRQKAHRPPLDRDRTVTASDTQAIDKMQHFGWAASKLPPLRSTKSFGTFVGKARGRYWDQSFPRRMSFSTVVEVVSATREDVTVDQGNPYTAFFQEKLMTMKDERMDDELYHLKNDVSTWVEDRVSQIELYNEQCGGTQSKADTLYHQRIKESQEVHEIVDLLTGKRTSINDEIRKVETLGAKLEYELQALQSKVVDVENGVDEFERQVLQLEARTDELDARPPVQRSWLRAYLGLGLL